MHSSVCFSFLCICDSLVSLSQSFMTFYYSKLWECLILTFLAPTARISGYCNQTWPGSGTVRGCAGFGIFKGLWQNPWFRKQGATLANFILCYQKIFVPKNLSLKFMHIYTDDQRTFWLVFAFYFTSCYNSRMNYRNLECRNKTVWMFNRNQNFRGNSFTQNY